MGGMIYDMTELVFGSGLAKELMDWLNKLLDAVAAILSSSSASVLIQAFSGIAALMMIIYFFQDLTSQASRDMFSLEKLIVSFIKLLAAFAIMIYLKEILDKLVELAKAFVSLVTEKLSMDPTAGGALGGVDRDEYKKYFKITRIVEGIGCILGLLIPWVLAQAAKLIATFVMTSSAVMLIVRALFSPLGVCQLFEEGSRSSGMRYLKGLLAEALGFAVVVAIMLVANKLSIEMTSSGGALTDVPEPDTLSDKLGFSGVFYAIIGKLVIAGGMASGSKIAHDVMGA